MGILRKKVRILSSPIPAQPSFGNTHRYRRILSALVFDFEPPSPVVPEKAQSFAPRGEKNENSCYFAARDCAFGSMSVACPRTRLRRIAQRCCGYCWHVSGRFRGFRSSFVEILDLGL